MEGGGALTPRRNLAFAAALECGAEIGNRGQVMVVVLSYEVAKIDNRHRLAEARV